MVNQEELKLLLRETMRELVVRETGPWLSRQHYEFNAIVHVFNLLC